MGLITQSAREIESYRSFPLFPSIILHSDHIINQINSDELRNCELPPILLRLLRSRIRTSLRQSWRRLWQCQGRCRHLLHGSAQARTDHEVSGARGHGRYPGHLRHDRGRHHHAEKYKSPHAVTPDSYTDKSAYAHLASGLCCGFSSLVIITLLRPQD
jgi:hypothetical protein